MTTQFTDLARRVAADGQVAADEVLALRREGWGDGIITREEAEALFAINNTLRTRDEQWCDFFVEAIGEFVLNGTQPRLQCNLEEAEWLIGQVDHDGVVESLVELETIVRIIERAENTPDRLKDYVIEQIEREVLSGTGPTRCGGELSDVHITSAEAQILRRVVFASGGHGPAAVSRFEAEMLFRLKDKTLAEANAPEWDELFLDGVSNYLKGFAFQNAQLEHGRAKELQEFVADNKANVGRFMGRMAREAPQVANHFGKVFGKRDAGPSFTEQAIAGEEITDHEQEWLDKMIEADGEIDELERRLIARIIDEGE
ncbi:hypothetical protein CD351_02360 [Erythrobacter sp. KY5]|uniref:hypothetical protein n=1 Tax=Erythrobacter sp. KY5 TaxID=2011159 RepID=UPI000DBEF9B5|nr:hypothetical protein [Erythrobacter sp. KY5]AWW73266.1 hypothetical protein CD351_02360 [Erythrobacter sp. KY5]